MKQKKQEKRNPKLQWMTRAAALLTIAAVASLTHAQQIVTPSTQLNARLHKFLQKYLAPPDKTAQINIAWVKTTSPSGKEAIVYVSGPNWCGSGGCNMLVLEPHGKTFRVIGNTTIVQLPISVLPRIVHGHPVIGVTVAGGGILNGYEALLAFDGEKYPGNPTMPPARKWNGPQKGKVIISMHMKAQPLYK